jgi:DNA-binding CsgD family transcriptional regulator
MIGSCASVLVEYDRAERWLGEGIAYAERVELWNHRHYMAAHLAHVQWAVGRWPEAEETATSALADGRGGITTRITADYVLGYLAMGRGDWPRATELLGDALRRGEEMAELQRLAPALWGLAEAALLRGDHETAVALCDRGHEASARVGDAAYLFPFLLTGVRPGWPPPGPRTPSGGSARSPGRWPPGPSRAPWSPSTTAAGWSTWPVATWPGPGRRWSGPPPGGGSAESATLARDARALAVRATAHTIVAEADRLLAAIAGGRPEPPWSPLTARELLVARLVAAGNTNREIAAELFLSPKTVSAHVEHILTKLGAARRTEIAAWVAALGRRAGESG